MKNKILIIMVLLLHLSLPGCGKDIIDFVNEKDNLLKRTLLFLNITSIDSTINVIGNDPIMAGDEIVMYTMSNIQSHPFLFEWDYGDGCLSSSLSGESKGNGRAVSHVYALPGDYTITLRIIDQNNIQYSKVTRNITVTGNAPGSIAPMMSVNPIFNLNFNNNDITYSPASAVTVELMQNGAPVQSVISDFTNGIMGKAVDLSNGKYIRINNISSILTNLGQFTISFWIKKKSYDSLSVLGQLPLANIISQVDTDNWESFFVRIQDTTMSCRVSTTNNLKNQTRDVNAVQAFRHGYYWQHCALTYDGTYLRLYIDGIEYINGVIGGETVGGINYTPRSLTGNIISSNVPLYIGVRDNNSLSYNPGSGPAHFNGYFDELKIYDRCLTKEQLFVGFELWHADLHAHTSQYISVKIPDEFTANSTNRVQAFITDNGAYTRNLTINNRLDVLTLINKTVYNNLNSTETILLNNHLLPALPEPGEYTITVQILDASDTVLATKSESLKKPYAGYPAGGIDENNAIRVNGNSFFPVTCFGLHDHANWEPDQLLKYWSSNGANPLYANNGAGQKWENPVINTGYGEGWGLNWSPELYSSYLDDAALYGLKAVGPTMWQGLNNTRGQNSDIENMVEYLVTNRDKTAMMMWSWMDEPDLHNVSAETIRAWTKICHINDSQHPVAVTLRGASFIPDSLPFLRTAQSYSAQYNAIRFGKITEPLNGLYAVDVLGYDYYPFDWAAPNSWDATVVATISALKNSRYYSRNMIPCYNYIETTDINENRSTPFFPSPEQLKMISWVHIVHGMKMVPWFHHHAPTPDINFRVMGDFVTDTTAFSDILAAAESSRTITVTIDTSGVTTTWSAGQSYTAGSLVVNNGVVYLCRVSHTSSSTNEPSSESTVLSWKHYWKVETRVDVLAKELNGHLYIFTVRPTEVGTAISTYTPSLGSPFSIVNSIGTARNATITISGISSANYSVYNESRNSTTSAGGAITDNYAPNAVHIYDITLP